MEIKFKTGKYYKALEYTEVLKCINKEKSIYLFKIVDGDKFGEAKCDKYNESSRLCKKCNNKTICSTVANMRYCIKGLKEVPKLKAILLYEE